MCIKYKIICIIVSVVSIFLIFLFLPLMAMTQTCWAILSLQRIMTSLSSWNMSCISAIQLIYVIKLDSKRSENKSVAYILLSGDVIWFHDLITHECGTSEEGFNAINILFKEGGAMLWKCSTVYNTHPEHRQPSHRSPHAVNCEHSKWKPFSHWTGSSFLYRIPSLWTKSN